MVIIALFDEMGHDVPLQMIDIYQRDIQRACKALSKAHTDKQRPHQSRTARKGYGRKVFLSDTGTCYGLIHYGNHILLVSARSKFGHHTTIGTMYFLRCRDIAEQHAIAQDGCRRVIAAALYTQDVNILIIFCFHHSSFLNKGTVARSTLLYI